MAHGITHNDTMVSANGITPWHKLGSVIAGVPTEAEAIKLAGFDFTLSVRPLYVPTGEGFDVRHVPAHIGQAIMRDQDGRVYDIVGGRYTIGFQPSDMIRHFRECYGEAVTLETAGTLLDKTRAFVWGKVKGEDLKAEVVKGDEVSRYIGFVQGFDSSFSHFYGETDIRGVCCNTIRAAIEEGKMGKFRHTKNAKAKIEARAAMLAAKVASFHKAVEQWRYLASVRYTEEDAKRFVQEVFPKPAKAEKADPMIQVAAPAPLYTPKAGVSVLDDLLGVQSSQSAPDGEYGSKGEEIIDRVYESIMDLCETGKGADIPGVKGSYWGLYNAAVEHIQYRKGRGEEGLTDKRLMDAAFGTANGLALQKALEFAQYGK